MKQGMPEVQLPSEPQTDDAQLQFDYLDQLATVAFGEVTEASCGCCGWLLLRLAVATIAIAVADAAVIVAAIVVGVAALLLLLLLPHVHLPLRGSCAVCCPAS